MNKPRILKIFKVENLRPPDGWLAGVEQKVIDQIAESLKLEGLREPIVVVVKARGEGRGTHILHGVHRWAAAKQAGIEEVECVIEEASGSLEEHRSKVLTENLDRRHLDQAARREMLAERVQQRTKKLIDSPVGQGVQARPTIKPKTAEEARRPSAKTLATREIAAEAGKSPDAVRKAVERSEKRVERLAEKAADPVAPAGLVVLDERKQEIPEHLVDRWTLHRDGIKTIGNLCRQIQIEIGKLATESDANWTQEQGAFRSAWGMVRVRTPFAICAWCKGESKGCKSCNGFGLQSENEQANTPAELLS